MKIKSYFVALFVCITSACISQPNTQANNVVSHHSYNKLPLQPESLIDLSSERVTFSLSDANAIEDITDWINNDHPSRADLYCTKHDQTCSKASHVLTSFGIPFKLSSANINKNDVALIYDRISTRDCNVASINNSHSNYIFGCSVATNMLQMIGDQQQFTKPNFLGLHDAHKAIENYKNIYINSSKME